MPADDTNDPIESATSASTSDTGRARETVESAKHGLRDAQERVRESSKSAVSSARRVGRETTEEIRVRGEELVDRQKNRAADHIGNYSAAARRAAEQLREEHDEVLAHYAETLAGTFERTADYLRNRDMHDFVGAVERYTRRHPEVVLGGLFIAGLAAARFFKAASPPDEFEDEEEYRVDYAYEEFGPGDDTGYAMGSRTDEQQEAATGATAGTGSVHSAT